MARMDPVTYPTVEIPPLGVLPVRFGQKAITRLLKQGLDVFEGLPQLPADASQQEQTVRNGEILDRSTLMLWSATYRVHKQSAEDFAELIEWSMLPAINAALTEALSKVVAQMQAVTKPTPPESPILQ